MQEYLRSLGSALLLSAFSHVSLQAQLVICSGEPVQFEMQDGYYGIKVWEYSTDSVNWTPTTVEESSPFLVTPQVAGYYRVRFEDVDCGSTYYSNVVRLVWNDQLHLQTVFTNNTISSNIDPVLWLSDPDSLSDVVYVVNGTEYQATMLYQPIPNPGIGFTVFARATNFMGCTVYSDTLSFFVEETNILGNGVLLPNAVVDLSGVLVNSSVDTALLDPNGQFSLNYNLDFIHDLLVAYREEQGESRIVALRLALDPGEFLLMNEQTTAWSMVFSQPDVILLAADSADSLRSWLVGRSDFITLTESIQSDLEQLGYVDLNATNKLALVDTLVFQILSEWVADGSREVGEGMYPLLSEGSGSNALQYSNEGINLVYAARFYKDGVPISGPVAFRGDGSPGFIQETILNFIAYAFQINSSLALRASNELLISDIMTSTQGFSSVDVRVVHGLGYSDSPETEMADDYNMIIYYYKSLAFLPLNRILGTGYNCAFNIATTIDNGFGDAQAQTTESGVRMAIYNMLFELSMNVAQCSGNGLLSTLTSVISVVQNAGWYVQYFYDGLTRESEVVYGYTVINNSFHGQLLIESNSNEAFGGLPGSVTNPIPVLTLKERPLFIRQGLAWPIIGPVLFLSEPAYYSGSPSDDGFYFNGIMSATESVRVNNGVTHTGLGFVDEYVSSMENSFLWRLSGSVVPPSSAALVVQLYHSGQNLPATIENYGAGSIVFNSAIELPVLSIRSGNNQIGRPGAELLQPCVVELKTQSGIPVGGYELSVEILAGGGDASPGLAITNETGQASVNWTLGDEGPQTMSVMVSPPSLGVLDDVTFQAESFDACEGVTFITDIDGNTYSTVSIGYQCWMAENLRTAHYKNGIAIPNVTDTLDWVYSWDNAGWCNQANEEVNDDVYGKLYNWWAISDTSGLCPEGWSVPSEWSWQYLELHLGIPFNELALDGYRGAEQNAGGNIQSTSLWISHDNQNATNATGFNGVPGGYRRGWEGYPLSDGQFRSKGYEAWWWSSTDPGFTGEVIPVRQVGYSGEGIWKHYVVKTRGLSVRCIKNN